MKLESEQLITQNREYNIIVIYIPVLLVVILTIMYLTIFKK